MHDEFPQFWPTPVIPVELVLQPMYYIQSYMDHTTALALVQHLALARYIPQPYLAPVYHSLVYHSPNSVCSSIPQPYILSHRIPVLVLAPHVVLAYHSPQFCPHIEPQNTSPHTSSPSIPQHSHIQPYFSPSSGLIPSPNICTSALVLAPNITCTTSALVLAPYLALTYALQPQFWPHIQPQHYHRSHTGSLVLFYRSPIFLAPYLAIAYHSLSSATHRKIHTTTLGFLYLAIAPQPQDSGPIYTYLAIAKSTPQHPRVI